jgi:hypothetical protein
LTAVLGCWCVRFTFKNAAIAEIAMIAVTSDTRTIKAMTLEYWASP